MVDFIYETFILNDPIDVLYRIHNNSQKEKEPQTKEEKEAKINIAKKYEENITQCTAFKV